MHLPRVGGEWGGSIFISVFLVCFTDGRSGCDLLAPSPIQKAMVLPILI